MFVKKFEAESLEQGLKTIRQELGPDTLILGTQKKKTGLLGKSVVEITAAYQKKQEFETKSVDDAVLMKIFPHRKYGSYKKNAEETPSSSQAVKRYMDIQDDKRQSPKKVSKSNKFEERLSAMGFSPESARELALKLSFDFSPEETSEPIQVDKILVRLLMNSLRVMDSSEFMDKKTWAVVGTSGSGKTSAVIKLAVLLRAHGKSVSLSSFDNRKVTSVAEMTSYSRLLRMPLKNPEPFSGPGVQLVDTPSLEISAESLNAELSKKIEILGASVLVTLDGGMRLTEMLRIIDAARLNFPIQAILLTKMDIASQRAVIHDLSKRVKIPLLSISESQSLKNTLKFLRQRELAQYIIRRGEL